MLNNLSPGGAWAGGGGGGRGEGQSLFHCPSLRSDGAYSSFASTLSCVAWVMLTHSLFSPGRNGGICFAHLMDPGHRALDGTTDQQCR